MHRRRSPIAIVDEVDPSSSTEARTPLIISGQAEDHTDLYLKMNQVAPMLKRQEGGPTTRTRSSRPWRFTW